MRVELEGRTIASEADFHDRFAEAFDLPYYGKNRDALWDVLTTDIERPVELVWTESERSREAMRADFDRIVAMLREVEAQDRSYGWEERFEVTLA